MENSEVKPVEVLDKLRSVLDEKRTVSGLDVKTHAWSTESRRNLERIEKGEAIAVITGQQPSLWGGPSLILHKLLTTLNIVRWLEREGVPAVPVFWNASEDHDLEEMLQVGLLGREGQIHRHRKESYRDGISAEFLSSFDYLEKEHSFSPFVQEILGRGSVRFAGQFTQSLQRAFGDQGLVVVEPRDLVSVASDFWGKIEERQDDLIRAYDQNEKAMLDRGQSLQAPRRYPLPLFGIHEDTGLRKAHSLISEGKEFSLKEMRAGGWRASPGALLRPLMAQWCLPIGVTVLGPAEAKYHEQLLGGFQPLGLKAPLVWPRLGGTWVPSWVNEKLNQIGENASDLIKRGRLDVTLGGARDMAIKGLSAHLLALRQEGVGRGESGYILDRLDRDLFSALGRFERGLLREELLERGLSPREGDGLLRFLLPRGAFQERALGWASILESKQHLKNIQETFADPFDKEHRIYS